MSELSLQTEVGDSFQGFCCPMKHYFSQNNALTDTLDIVPRVFICQKRLRTSEMYRQYLLVINKGMYPRRLNFSTDSPSDTLITIDRKMQFKDLQPNQSMNVTVQIEPTERENINRRRHIFIQSEHPNIIFEVPIIVVDKVGLPSIPKSIAFPSSLPKTKAYYEFTVYNQTLQPSSVIIKSLNPKMSVHFDRKSVPKKDFIRVLLVLNIKDMKPLNDALKIKLGNAAYINIPVEHKPIPASLFIGASHLQFEVLKFGRIFKKEFTVCNESQEPIHYTVKFLTEKTELDDVNLDANNETDDEVELQSIERSSSSLGSYDRAEEGFDRPDGGLKRAWPPKANEDKFDLKAFRHFTVNSKGGNIKVNSSSRFTVTFHPIMDDDCDFDENIDPPYTVQTKLLLIVKDELHVEQKSLVLSGLIAGPEVQFTPLSIDVRKVYLGEEHCEQITALNVDGQVNAKVYFKDYYSESMGVCVLSPSEGFDLKTCESGVFNLSFFSRIVGRFIIKLRFKVKCGYHHKITLSGDSHQVHVKHFPEIVEFGNVAIGVPQKRYVLLMNPLSVPMTVQCRPSVDGVEDPLTLNVQNINEFLPVTVKNPIKQLEEAKSEYDENDPAPVEFSDRTSSEYSYQSLHDGRSTSTYSTLFEEDVLDPMEEFATKVITNIKKHKPFEKPEVEKRILEEALESLIEGDYFQDFKFTNYKYMDWNALPNDPRELYVDSEIIFLKPNTGKSITVMVIPNHVGHFNRAIEIRCCPYNEYDEEDKRVLVDSKLMVSKLWLEYHCRVPEIIWDQIVTFEKRTIYTGQEYHFDMMFENVGQVGGFLYYDIIPGCADGEMFFLDSNWKFYIPPDNIICAYCGVVFKRFGDIQLSGIIKVVGHNHGTPFFLRARVLPTKVSISPKAIYRRQNVLETTRVYVFIENVTPTVTWVTLSLKHEAHHDIEPRGAILAPTGQGFYIVLTTKYYDPEIYKNILYVNLRFGNPIEIPLTYNIEGMPIFFEPNIKDGLHVGVILTCTVEEFHDNVVQFSKDIKVINRGERSYRLIITKLKNGNSKCSVPTLRARLNVNPNSLLLAPGSEQWLHITASAYEETTVYNEFRIQIVDQTNRQRFQNIRFVATATFVAPELVWSRREIIMVYHRTHRFKEHLQLEILHLTNLSQVEIESVNLKIMGPFKIRTLFEHRFRKELDFSLAGSEKIELTILLNKAAIEDKFCTHADGRIYCTANGRMQKSVSLRVNMFHPDVKISQPEMIIFTKFQEDNTMVEIENVGCLEAEYKWKKVNETVNYIGESDDARDFSREILSEIFQMLELSDADDDTSYEESTDRPNMTARYQRYRCKLERSKPHDAIGVEDILNDLIDNLDFEHKRYMLRLGGDDNPSSETFGSTDYTTMNSDVERTIERILQSLNLEDSYDVSEASSDECDRERRVYFYEKSGMLLPKEKRECQLHLPAVRKGYAKKTCFELVVVGGHTRNLSVTLVNLEKTIEILRDSVFLGMKPWYEQYHISAKIQNVTQFTLKIRVIAKTPPGKKKRHRLCDGYVEVVGASAVDLNPQALRSVKLSGIMGFSDEFTREVRAIVNNGEEKTIRLRGQGIMPILSVTSCLKRVEQDLLEVAVEYELLQRVYYFDIFKGIVEEDENLSLNGEECGSESHFSHFSQFSSINDQSQLSIISSSPGSTRKNDLRFYRLMKTYVVVNNNDELPNATVLEQLLETEKFKEQLHANDDTNCLLNMVYQDHVKEQKAYDERMPTNLKHFTVQPLPFELHGHILNMNEMKVDQYRRFEVDMHFFGPGRLIAAARTAVKIPGLLVDFEVYDSVEERSYIYYNAEDKAPDFYDKPYRNMYEREIDKETDPKLKHAHSFDVDELNKHQREKSAKERQNIKNYYNSLNKSVYLEHKHHFILCKIYAKSRKNVSGTNLRVVILIKPEGRFYEDSQLIEDFVYIDLHMGPTLPILLRGMIRKPPL